MFFFFMKGAQLINKLIKPKYLFKHVGAQLICRRKTKTRLSKTAVFLEGIDVTEETYHDFKVTLISRGLKNNT